NETTADLVGDEVEQAVITAFGLQLEPSRTTGDSELTRELRRIRAEAEQMLAAGAIEEAEAYMERERQQLFERGYRIRRLNQAYFAFYGSYAAGPAATTELVDGLRTLRSRSASLGAFLGRVGGLTSLDDL